MFPRLTTAILIASLAFSFAGCSGIAAATAAPGSPAASTTQGPAATAESSGPSPKTVLAPAPTAGPDSGNVDAPVTPALSVEPVGAVAIRVTLLDPAAKAWRVTVAGVGSSTGSAAVDSWTLTVETGDVAPVITTTDTVNGVVGEPQEQPGLEAGAANGRVCSVAVPVCVRAASVVLPHDGDGTLVLEIGRTDTTTALAVTGATAGWPTEPFLLGPWTTTEAFPWEG